MNAGSIHNPNTAAGRVYALLRTSAGDWWSGWRLTTAARVTAVGTRISEVRHQLPPGERLEHKAEHDGQRGSWYRLVVDADKGSFERVDLGMTYGNPIDTTAVV